MGGVQQMFQKQIWPYEPLNILSLPILMGVYVDGNEEGDNIKNLKSDTIG